VSRRRPDALSRSPRSDRLPPAARRAIRALEATFAAGTQEEYQAALEQLTAAHAALTAGQRERLNAELESARERAEAARHLVLLAMALGGPWEHVAQLPGDIELVRLAGGDDGQLLATAPTSSEDDSPEVVELVRAARAALAAASCQRCDATLAYRADGQVFLAHARRCRLHEDKLTKARAAAKPAPDLPRLPQ
jgi:hypothetical protein